MTVATIGTLSSSPVSLVEPMLTVVASNATTTASTKTVPLLLSTAPKIDSKEDALNYLNALMDYMTKVLSATVALSQNQSALVKTQSDAGAQMVTLAQSNLAKVQEELKAFEASQDAPWWSKLVKALSIVAAGLMVIIGCITLNPALAFAGAFMMAMSTSGASEKLDSALADAGIPLVGRIFIQIGISLAAGGLTTGAAVLFNRAAATAATVGAGAGGAAAAGASQATVSVSNFILQTLMYMGITGVFSNILKPLGEDAATYGSMGISVATGFAGMAGAAKAGSSLLSKLPVLMQNIKSVSQFVMVISSIISAAFSIVIGANEMKRAGIQEALGLAMSKVQAATGMMDQNTSAIKMTTDLSTSLGKTYAEVNSHWDEYVAAYRTGTEVMI